LRRANRVAVLSRDKTDVSRGGEFREFIRIKIQMQFSCSG